MMKGLFGRTYICQTSGVLGAAFRTPPKIRRSRLVSQCRKKLWRLRAQLRFLTQRDNCPGNFDCVVALKWICSCF
ncbi:hypothetical protein MRX96_018592 [Rhipicephalus microplus]